MEATTWLRMSYYGSRWSVLVTCVEREPFSTDSIQLMECLKGGVVELGVPKATCTQMGSIAQGNGTCDTTKRA